MTYLHRQRTRRKNLPTVVHWRQRPKPIWMWVASYQPVDAAAWYLAV